jgi:[acyl-carrier-protein] S-malonyltransferase
MAEAREQMRQALAGCQIARPSFPVVSNVTADVYPNDPDGIRETLVAQIVSPVLWTDSMERLIRDGHRLFVEVGPGKVLTGLVREINREVKALSVQHPDDVSTLRAAFA